MAVVFLGIGSNMGDKRENCKGAVATLSSHDGMILLKTSSLYYTEPYGDIEQDWFVNAVAQCKTELGPNDLLRLLKSIESAFGRMGGKRGGPRTLDLDLLFYDDLVLKRDGLTIPHPFSHERAFVLVPLAEIAPDLIHPVIKKRARELLQNLNDGKKVQLLQEEQPFAIYS
jgi:2-amino-4-hydroxy-6-hydroxymethyldihydropteridine diphosphokinase